MDSENNKKYLTVFGAWALAFGCSVGWGSFVMPGSTFLPLAGPIGTTIGICLGGLAMLVLAKSYHYLILHYPEGGGTYSYTKYCFGYDHGFLSGWFLFLTYIAVIWANATALPLIVRTVFGSVMQFGFNYEIAGFHVFMGEIMLAIGSLVVSAFICMNKKLSQNIQFIMATALILGIIIVTGCAIKTPEHAVNLISPSFGISGKPVSGVFTIFALAPWAYVGFESISHSAHEIDYDPKYNFGIFIFVIVFAAVVYSFLSLLSVTYLPEGCNSWIDYVSHLSAYSGIESQPAFYGANGALENIGVIILAVAAFCGIFTGLIGNYIALSRLLCAMSEDDMVNPWIGRLNKNDVPANAIMTIMLISIILPFLGRTAISWIVDVTTVGASIAYGFTAASAHRIARKENDRQMLIYSNGGMAISVLFALLFMIPNLLAVKTLSTESYLILAIWSILGFIYFHRLLRKDTHRRMGRSIVTWVVLLGLIIVTSSIWVTQALETRLNSSTANIIEHYQDDTDAIFVQNELDKANDSMKTYIMIQMGMIVYSLAILFDIYSLMQKREQQIEIEKALAEESSKAKTSFLSNMSHEIRTPMNAIIGLDNILLRDPDITPKIRENLEKIGASAKHLLGLINDILDMSRIESGRTEIKNEEFSFREFLDQINIIINGQCLDKGLHYDCSIVNHVSDYYFGDSMKLKQVLINILGNSVKFTEPGGDISLVVEEKIEDDNKRMMKFVMKDTGIGMDKEFIPKLFEAFSQENASLTSNYGGSGLGMAITKSYIELMNGRIEVESEKGIGSTFTVTLPLVASEKVAHTQRSLDLPEDLKVIVIDDDMIACQHTQYVLQAIGISSDITTDPLEGLGMIKEAYDNKTPYELIITDYKMPDLNGLDLIHQVRSFDEGKTPVIMLTGYNYDVLEEDAKKENIGAILAKPLFSDILNKEIYTVLGKESDNGSESSVMTEETFFEKKLSGKRILIAEDVEQNAEILTDLLELEGMISEHARNGKEALELFNEKPVNYFDAILMDVRMPVMDGLTATKEIRKLAKADAGDIPIIAMTANVFDEDVERSLASGMNAHLSKPIEPNVLYETLVAHLKDE